MSTCRSYKSASTIGVGGSAYIAYRTEGFKQLAVFPTGNYLVNATQQVFTYSKYANFTGSGLEMFYLGNKIMALSSWLEEDEQCLVFVVTFLSFTGNGAPGLPCISCLGQLNSLSRMCCQVCGYCGFRLDTRGSFYSSTAFPLT